LNDSTTPAPAESPTDVSDVALAHVACKRCVDAGHAATTVCGTPLDEIEEVAPQGALPGEERCVVCFSLGITCPSCGQMIKSLW
jgi:hypothetical protein